MIIPIYIYSPTGDILSCCSLSTVTHSKRLHQTIREHVVYVRFASHAATTMTLFLMAIFHDNLSKAVLDLIGAKDDEGCGEK